MEKIIFEISEEGKRLDLYITEKTDLTRTRVQQLIKEGNISVNNKKSKPSYKVEKNDLIEIVIPDEKEIDLAPENIKIKILYEDKDILVCHKPAGLAVQNARVGSMDMESLLKNYIAQKVPGKMPYLGIIHRLDQPVEGVLVFALNPKAAADLSRQMTAGKIKKTYLAVTEGTVKVKSAKLVDWLKKDGRTNSSAVVEGGTSGAKKAILSYEVLETWKNKEDAQDCGERNLIRIDLDTGRHHQIRVQMAHAGMPLVGDRKYNPGQNSQEPLALCSAKLGFQHPVTKKQLEFQVQPAGMAFKRH